MKNFDKNNKILAVILIIVIACVFVLLTRNALTPNNNIIEIKDVVVKERLLKVDGKNTKYYITLDRSGENLTLECSASIYNAVSKNTKVNVKYDVKDLQIEEIKFPTFQ